MWPTLWWTRPAIADLLEIVPALFRPVRQLLFGLDRLRQISRYCRQIIQNPMHPRPSRRIWIITDQGESFCSSGDWIPSQRRGDIFAVTGVLRRNWLPFSKAGTCNLDCHSGA